MTDLTGHPVSHPSLTVLLVVQRDVLDPERAAADGVCLVLVLLVARPQRQLVDEVERHRPLPDAHLLRLELGRVVVPDLGWGSDFLLIFPFALLFN